MEIPNQSQSFSKPKIFEALEPYLAQGCYPKRAIEEGNYGRMADIINGESRMHLPVVYISKNMAERYEVDPEAVAEKLFGIALVYAEPNHSYSKNLMERTQNKSAHNGAVGIYWGAHKRFISVNVLHGEEYSRIDFFHRVAQLSAMTEIEEGLSWSGLIRKRLERTSQEIHDKTLEITNELTKFTGTMMLANLSATMEMLKAKSNEAKLSGRIDELTKQIDDLTCQIEGLHKSSEIQGEKIKSLEEEILAKDSIIKAMDAELSEKKKELQEFIHTFDTDEQLMEEAQEKIARLTEENRNLLSQLEIFRENQSKKSAVGIDIHIDTDLTPSFETELTDFLKSVLWTLFSQYDKLKDNKGQVFHKRLYDVLSDMYSKNISFDPAKSQTSVLQAKIEKAFRSHGTQGKAIAQELSSECGFTEKEFNGTHHKLYLGSENCSFTVSSTAKNDQSFENQLHDALNATLLVKKISINL